MKLSTQQVLALIEILRSTIAVSNLDCAYTISARNVLYRSILNQQSEEVKDLDK